MIASRREELTSLQNAYVRLLYSDETRREYETDPVAFAARRGLSERMLRLLPNTRSDGFKAELFGRRLQVIQEIRPSYAATLGVIMDGDASDLMVAKAAWFNHFLESAHFFDATFSLPHPSGIGRGYEGLTRFFFWARDYYALRGPEADLRLRTELYADAARVLEALAFEASDEPYPRLRGGMFWLRLPCDREAAFALTPDRRFLTVHGADVGASLRALDMVDLDVLPK
jgi:hypothetical protein